MERTQLEAQLDTLLGRAGALPERGIGTLARVQAGLIMMIALEQVCTHQDENPYPTLERAIRAAEGVMAGAAEVSSELSTQSSDDQGVLTGVGHTVKLFEQAWTAFSDQTYDHSVSLVRQRLINSGFDETFFRDKVCFDGGCGTGRLSLAMAQLGARKVVAVDLGRESLDYFRKVIARYGMNNIEVVAHDITDLAPWQSGSFDFVASNGVLHHTEHPDKGLLEHFRITAEGGVFWVYLYGAGGLYWSVYDRLRPLVEKIPSDVIRSILHYFAVREGLIYTYLDNFLAPRVYYGCDEFLKLMETVAHFDWRHARGMSEIDDTKILLGKAYGPEIYGPQGEVRVALTKK